MSNLSRVPAAESCQFCKFARQVDNEDLPRLIGATGNEIRHYQYRKISKFHTYHTLISFSIGGNYSYYEQLLQKING